VLNLLRLSHLTGDYQYDEMAEKIKNIFSGQVSRQPSTYTMFMTSLDFGFGPVYEVAIIGNPEAQDTLQMLEALRSRFIPNKVAILMPAGEESQDIMALAKFTKGYSAIDGKSTAYVCANHTCKLPTTDATKMLELLRP
jgi:uncharacterized protein YyaL (SSP411 family)